MADALDDTHLLEFRADDFHGSGRQAMDTADIATRWQELVVGVLDLDPEGYEGFPMIPIIGKEDPCQIIQPGYLPAQRRAYLNLGPCRDSCSPP